MEAKGLIDENGGGGDTIEKNERFLGFGVAYVHYSPGTNFGSCRL
jgi:hypothetical protein